MSAGRVWATRSLRAARRPLLALSFHPGRKGYANNSSLQHRIAKSSHLSWIIGAALVTIPSLVYVYRQKHSESDHDHDEQPEEAGHEGGQQQDSGEETTIAEKEVAVKGSGSLDAVTSQGHNSNGDSIDGDVLPTPSDEQSQKA